MARSEVDWPRVLGSPRYGGRAKGWRMVLLPEMHCPILANGQGTTAGSPAGSSMNYQDRISIEPGKRGGKPCIRGMRITVYDVLDCLASGMSEQEILDDFPDLTRDDICACLAFAADRERRAARIIRRIVKLPCSPRRRVSLPDA